MDLTRLVPINDAAKIVGMSLPTFWRFRKQHGIQVLTGHKIHMDDVGNALEVERGLNKPSPLAVAMAALKGKRT